LLKQTRVQLEKNSAFQTLLHSVALASYTADRKNYLHVCLWHRGCWQVQNQRCQLCYMHST